MIVHAVWLQPKPETTEEELQVVLERVKTLQEVIPGMVEIHVGRNLNPFNQGYTQTSFGHALSVTQLGVKLHMRK